MNMKMPLDVFCVELDWDPIPDDICKQIVDFLRTSKFLENQEYHKHGLYNFEMHLGPEFLIDWCRDNLPININDGFTVSIQQTTEGILPPHVDSATRDSSFNFLITEPVGVTTWYDVVYRTPVHSVVYESRKWYQHQGNVPHGVTGIVPPRIAVSIYKDLYNI